MCVLAAWCTRWYGCISARVQGRDISSECTSKVGISTFKCITFPSWCSSFMTNRSSSRFIWVIRVGQFHERTLQSKCIQAVLASSMWDILVSNATRICYFIYLWIVLSIRSRRETWGAHLSSPRCTTSVYWIGELWVVPGYVTYKEKMRFPVNPERRKQIYVSSECNTIFFHRKSRYQASQIQGTK